GAIGQRQVGAHLTVAELHPDVARLHWWLYPSAPLPKFVIHCGTLSHELRKQKGHWQAYDSSAAFRFEVPAMSLPRPVQELQIGGTSLSSSRALPAKIRARSAAPISSASTAAMVMAISPRPASASNGASVANRQCAVPKKA